MGCDSGHVPVTGAETIPVMRVTRRSPCIRSQDSETYLTNSFRSDCFENRGIDKSILSAAQRRTLDFYDSKKSIKFHFYAAEKYKLARCGL